MSSSISDKFLAAGVLVGVVAAGYDAYLVWTMNWGTGSRNFGLGVGALVFLSMAAFGISVFVFVLIGSYIESFLDRRRR